MGQLILVSAEELKVMITEAVNAGIAQEKALQAKLAANAQPKKTDNRGRLFTLSDIARYFGITRRCVSNWVQDYGVKPVPIPGRRKYYHLDDFEHYRTQLGNDGA